MGLAPSRPLPSVWMLTLSPGSCVSKLPWTPPNGLQDPGVLTGASGPEQGEGRSGNGRRQEGPLAKGLWPGLALQLPLQLVGPGRSRQL